MNEIRQIIEDDNVDRFEKFYVNCNSNINQILNESMIGSDFVIWIMKQDETNSMVQYIRGHMFYCGIGVNVDYENAFICMKKSSDLGNRFAQIALASYYMGLINNKISYKNAIEVLEKAAMQHLLSAYIILARIYAGIYLESRDYLNIEKALYWYIKVITHKEAKDIEFAEFNSFIIKYIDKLRCETNIFSKWLSVKESKSDTPFQCFICHTKIAKCYIITPCCHAMYLDDQCISKIAQCTYCQMTIDKVMRCNLQT
jgi:hypothetical protein